VRPLGAVIAGLGLLLTACSPASQDEIDGVTTTTTSTTLAPITTTTTTAPPTTVAAIPRGGTVTIVNGQPETLHPFDQFHHPRITEAIFSGATTVEAGTQRIIPELLAEVPSLANGGVVLNADGSMTVEYVIHEDAVWQDGTPVTGDDFLFTLDAILASAVGDSRYRLIERVSVVTEEKLFQVTFLDPVLGYDLLFDVVAPRHQVEGTDFLADWHEEPWMTAGPFVVAEYVPGEHIRLVRNENYWRRGDSGERLPYLDEVVIQLADAEAHTVLFRNGEVDALSAFADDPDELLALADIPGVAVDFYPDLSGQFTHLALQVGPTGADVNPETAMTDLRLRRAIAHAFDRRELTTDVLGDLGQPLDSHVEPFSPSLSVAGWRQYGYDPERAAALVADVCADLERDCAADPIPVVLTTMSWRPVRVAAVVAIATALEFVGLAPEIRLWETGPDTGTCWDQGLCEGSLSTIFSGPDLTSLVSIHEAFDPRSPVTAAYGWGQSEPSASSPAVARYIEIIDEMRSTIDPDVLGPLIAEAEQILADEVVFIPLFMSIGGAAVWDGTIGNYRPDSTFFDMWNIAEWYRADLAG
jgi:ABC-type transport system substrate-binding protein